MVILKTHWPKEGMTITLCGHPRSSLLIASDDKELTCHPCRMKRGLSKLPLPTMRDLAAWRRDATGAFDVDAIRGLLALLDSYRAQFDLADAYIALLDSDRKYRSPALTPSRKRPLRPG